MSNEGLLLGRRAAVRANDFVDAVSMGRIRCMDPDTNAVLIELDAPLHANGLRFTHIVASARLARDNIEALVSTGALGCGVTWVPEGRFDVNAPLDLSWWRGGAAAIAELVLLGEDG